jgi:hypothetical protein
MNRKVKIEKTIYGSVIHQEAIGRVGDSQTLGSGEAWGKDTFITARDIEYGRGIRRRGADTYIILRS